MTEITRSIEIIASKNRVWSQIHPSNWPSIFFFVKAVDGYTDGKAGVGTTATVVAGGGAEEALVRYQVKITEFIEKEKIAYDRYGGPLTGRGVMTIKSLQTGTLLRRTSYYDDDLSPETIKTLSDGMEHDNMRLKQMIEKLKKTN